jgi:hypothetical protein
MVSLKIDCVTTVPVGFFNDADQIRRLVGRAVVLDAIRLAFIPLVRLPELHRRAGLAERHSGPFAVGALGNLQAICFVRSACALETQPAANKADDAATPRSDLDAAERDAGCAGVDRLQGGFLMVVSDLPAP